MTWEGVSGFFEIKFVIGQSRIIINKNGSNLGRNVRSGVVWDIDKVDEEIIVAKYVKLGII